MLSSAHPGSGWANTSAAAASRTVRSRWPVPVASQAPPGFTARADLGEFRRALRLSNARRDLLIVQGEPADLPPFGYRPPARRVTAFLAETTGGKRPLLPGLHAAAGVVGYIEDSWAAVVHLHLKCPPGPDLH